MKAGQDTVTEETVIFTGAAASIAIECQTGSTSNLEVNVPGLHDAGDWFVLTAGDKQTFRIDARRVRAVSVRPVGVDADVNWGVSKQAQRYSP